MKKYKSAFIIAALITASSCNKEAEKTSPANAQLSSPEKAGKHFIGEQFGGGIIFYLNKSGNHGLIAAGADFEEPSFWSQKDTLNGAKDTALGSGAANTVKIFQTQGYPQFEIDTYAALECLELILNGYQDWYLPSKNELYALYQSKTIVGGFQPYSYWSSTESNATKAWLINFNNGLQSLQIKTGKYAFRPIRRF